MAFALIDRPFRESYRILTLRGIFDRKSRSRFAASLTFLRRRQDTLRVRSLLIRTKPFTEVGVDRNSDRACSMSCSGEAHVGPNGTWNGERTTQARARRTSTSNRITSA